MPQISISDDNHHVTEAIGSYYGDDDMATQKKDPRPYSFIASPSETYEPAQSRGGRRNGSYFDPKRESPPRTPLGTTGSNEKLPSPTGSGGSNGAKGVTRMGSYGSENGGKNTPPSPPPLSRNSSTETAIREFPLNDIDYESSPAAVAQELSNLQAIRRMSMNVDVADPDLAGFGGGFAIPTMAPNADDDDDDASRLFWVPARLHPELAPKEFKTFIEDRVDKIKRRSGDSDSLSVDGLQRAMSGSSLRRKKSMLSRQIDTKGDYEDGADRLERKKSQRMSVEGSAQVELSELETLVNDPEKLMRRMSLDTARRSIDSEGEVPASQDMPILPPGGKTLQRSRRTAYRRGSIRKGERQPLSKRAQHRQTDSDIPDVPDLPPQSPIASSPEDPVVGLSRVQTEPIPQPSSPRQTYPTRTDASLRWREKLAQEQPSKHDSVQYHEPEPEPQPQPQHQQPPAPREQERTQPPPQQRQFQSRLASGGRTTAQLPGFDNTNPLPQVLQTLPDGTQVPVAANLVQSAPDHRRASHEHSRHFQRGGAHMRPPPGREHQRSSTIDDISSRPSPLPGIGNTSTDALTMVPTFDDRKTEKKDSSRKSSWKWFRGNDDDDDKKSDKGSDTASVKSSKSGKLSKASGDKARLDVLQNSIDGTMPARGRESIVLSRDDLKLDEERKKESKKSSESKKEKEKDSGLLSALFSRKKASDGDLKEKKRRSDRNLSPEAPPRFLKPDIDYNWTRFSILEERAIYRMAHIKLANPRRALYSQVLLSNFMYSYLAKVQMMHPQVQIPAAHQKSQQRGKPEQQQQQPAEYSQYQKWQQVSLV